MASKMDAVPGEQQQRTTLVGVATGRADGGVAIVRLSGPRAVAIAAEVVRGELPAARRLVRRRIWVGGQDEADRDEGAIEDGMVVVMPGPGSFTGEDVVELHVHAGQRCVDGVVAALLRRGATAAGPGEFTRRAFDRGRLSLDQAEGIAAVIGARTEAALRQARRLAAGELGEAVEGIRGALVTLQAEIEANLDFPEDVDPGDVMRWRQEASTRREAVARWLARFEAGRRARSRPRVVLAGPPNAGKSSLFNALLGRARALVADTPGTTRDYVEAELELGPHACVLVDTAGLREGAEAVEQAGVIESRGQLAGADVVLWIEAVDGDAVVDGAGTGEDLEAAGATVIHVETKRDLGTRREAWIGVTLADGGTEGLEVVRDALAAWFRAGEDEAWIGLARHRGRAQEAVAALDEAIDHLHDDERLELAAFSIGVAQGRLGEITGRTALGPVGREVLDEIFARFCIGK